MRPRQRLAAFAIWAVVGPLTACSSTPASPPAHTSAAPTGALWGDLKPVVSVKELKKR